MKQHEQVIKVMQENGGYATLGFLYHNVDVSRWSTKTPYASIRRIVQDERYFFKITPGLWALKELRDSLFSKFEINGSIEKQAEFSHSYVQGLLLEIGKLKKYQTFVPAQDKNKRFLDQPLKQVATTTDIYGFSYPEITQRAKTIDVIWFNERKLPHAFFEVEHTTDMQNSLLKFHDLQDFHSKFYIVSSPARRKEYDHKIALSAFQSIKHRVEFLDYEKIANLHSESFKQYHEL